MTKTEKIKKYLTQNNNQVLIELIQHQRTQHAVANEFDVTTSLVKHVILQIEPDFDLKYHDYMFEQLVETLYYLQRGITLDVLITFDVYRPTTNSTDLDILMKRFKSQLRHYGIITKLDRYELMTPYSLKVMVSNVYIERLLSKHLTNQQIVDQYHISGAKVTKVKRFIQMFGHPMPFVSGRSYAAVKEHLGYYEQYLKGNVQPEDLYEQLIIATMTKYIKKDGFNNA